MSEEKAIRGLIEAIEKAILVPEHCKSTAWQELNNHERTKEWLKEEGHTLAHLRAVFLNEWDAMLVRLGLV